MGQRRGFSSVTMGAGLSTLLSLNPCNAGLSPHCEDTETETPKDGLMRGKQALDLGWLYLVCLLSLTAFPAS